MYLFGRMLENGHYVGETLWVAIEAAGVLVAAAVGVICICAMVLVLKYTVRAMKKN